MSKSGAAGTQWQYGKYGAHGAPDGRLSSIACNLLHGSGGSTTINNLWEPSSWLVVWLARRMLVLF